MALDSLQINLQRANRAMKAANDHLMDKMNDPNAAHIERADAAVRLELAQTKLQAAKNAWALR